MNIDTTFDFRTDAGGRDPDAYSATLRQYHRVLWSKPLPSGEVFELGTSTPGVYLHHSSRRGEFFLSSDAMIPTFTLWPAMQPITSLLSDEENEAFRTLGYTIGAMIVFPGNRIDRKLTINVARGFNQSIADRFDLTLECIRRHYVGESSPLADVLERYADFFALFESFDGYVRFFLLDDLVEDGCVKCFMPFDNFGPPAVPKDVATYVEYRRRAIEFIKARNRRIKEACASALAVADGGTASDLAQSRVAPAARSEQWTRESFLEALLDEQDRATANWLLDQVERTERLEGANDHVWYGARPGGALFLNPYGREFSPLQLWVNSAGHLLCYGNWSQFSAVRHHPGFAELAALLGQDHHGGQRGVRVASLDAAALWQTVLRCSEAINASIETGTM